MIPKPPFERDLKEAEEVVTFGQLQEHLRVLWTALFPQDDQPYTSVVIPSRAPIADALTWSTHLEERLLFLLIRLRNPRARLVYVTSQPLDPVVIEYYLQLLVGVPAAHALSRLTLLSAHDHSPRPLAQKILERPRLLERIRVSIGDKTRAYLTVPESTPKERRLAVLLGIPMNGLDPRLAFLGSPERSRELFEEAGVAWAEPGEGEAEARPSVEIRLNPLGQTSLSSTHEHERPGLTALPRRARLFPAQDAYRTRLHEAAFRIGQKLAARGVTSRCSVEFAASRASSGFRLRATRLRLGMGEVTHPMLALRFLTGGGLDPATGLFVSPRGQAKFYRASDDVQSDSYKGLLPQDLVEIATIDHLGFDPRCETGVLFHMIGALSQFGRLGMVAIGNTRAEADQIFDRTLGVLDHETRFGRR